MTYTTKAAIKIDQVGISHSLVNNSQTESPNARACAGCMFPDGQMYNGNSAIKNINAHAKNALNDINWLNPKLDQNILKPGCPLSIP